MNSILAKSSLSHRISHKQWNPSNLDSIIINKMLLDTEIQEYQTIYKQLFNIDISTEDALEFGIKLIVLLETITKANNILLTNYKNVKR